MESHTIASPRANFGLSLLAGLITAVWRVLERRQRIARDMDALREMDDRLLRDMGISRWDLR